MSRRRGRGVFLRATALLSLVLCVAAGVPAAGAQPRLQVQYEPPVLTVEVRETDLAAVLRAVGERVGFSVGEVGAAHAPVTVALSGSVETVLRQLLVGTSHALFYQAAAVSAPPGAGDIELVVILGDGGTTAEVSASLVATAEEPEGTLSELLRTQALATLSGLVPAESSLGSAPPGPAAPTQATVAAMTQRAQQNVQTLVEALNAATRALTESAATK